MTGLVQTFHEVLVESSAFSEPLASRLTSSAYEAPQSLSYEQWESDGYVLGKMARASAFWVGDWINFGEAAYGEKYSQALEVTGLKYGTLLNYASVARRVQTSHRCEVLTFNHHAAVASLEPDEQNKWLTRATASEWDSDELRKNLGRSATIVALKSCESEEWYTPPKYLDAVREVLGSIDLDPSSNEIANATVGASAYFTEDDDGLLQDWRGQVFLNPPYGRKCPLFVDKLTAEYDCGRVTGAILLVNAYSTETRWFQPLLSRPVCLTDHRLDFYSPSGRGGNSTHGSAFIYFGPNDSRFVEVFSAFGAIVSRIDGLSVVRPVQAAA